MSLTIPYALKQTDGHGKLKLDSSYPFLEQQTDAFLAFIKRRM
ncbi:MAG: hypothetical protein PHZ09_14345 [Eubacteriales bacterium]|nr:hypothetical protein [Eubacteriales bacterium]